MKALGRAIASGYTFRRSSADRFNITSPRGRVYTTTPEFCTCPDATMRGGSYERDGRRYCKHSLIVAQLIDFLKEVG